MEKRIPKLSIILLSLFAFLMPFIKLNASSGTINLTTNRYTAVIGETVTVTVTLSSNEALGSWSYTIDYDTSKLKLQDGTSHVVGYTEDGSQRSASYTYTFKIIASGTSTVSVKAYEAYALDETSTSLSVSPVKIKGVSQEELEASYSTNNNLSSITVDGYALSPEFNKDTLEYTVNVPSDVEHIKLNAEVEDGKSFVSGTGEYDVSEGENKFELVVTAENGSTKVYTVRINVQDENPIEVTVDGKKYIVIKRASTLTAPTTFTPTTIEINGIEVPAFKSDITSFILVGLKSTDGTANLFIYDKEKKSYTLYKEIKSESLLIYPTDTDTYPEGYTKTTIEINGIEVPAYAYLDEHEFYLVHGINILTGEETFYQYDNKNNTFSRYNSKIIDTLTETNKNFLMIIVLLGVETLVMLIILIITILKKNKRQKIRRNDLSKIKDKDIKKVKEEKKETKKEEQSKETKENKEEKENNEAKEEKINTVDVQEIKFKDLEKE